MQSIISNPTLGDVKRMEAAKPAEDRGKTLALGGIGQAKIITSKEVVEDIIDSKTWGEAFVMEAIKFYSAMISRNAPVATPEDFPEGVPTPTEWHETAVFAKTQLEMFQGA